MPTLSRQGETVTGTLFEVFENFWSAAVTVMFALPQSMPVTRPVDDTVATLVFELAHVRWLAYTDDMSVLY
jgi:hypothetical protein